MFTQITKTVESNTKLAQDVASTMTAAAFAYGRTLVDVNTKIAESVKSQATAAYKAAEGFKMPQSFEDFKIPGLDQFTKNFEQFATSTKAKTARKATVDAE
jgi:hypothetical protein